MLELERHGFDARAAAYEEEALGAHRIIGPADATGEVHMSVGSDIARWRHDHPEAREVVRVDLRTPAQRARYVRLRGGVLARMTAAGLDTANLEDRLSLVGFDPATPVPIKRMVNQMATIGQPAAVFVSDRVGPA